MPKLTPPRHCRHRAKDLAYVRVEGRQIYLGKWDSPEAAAEYDRICREWRAAQDPERYALTVADVAMRYIDHAELYYRKGGQPTSEVQVVTDALKRLVDLFRTDRACDLRPRHIKRYQEALTTAGLARTTINGYVARLRRVLRWAVAEEIVPGSVLTEIEAVAPLKKGRTRAREPVSVKPVPDALVDAVQSYVPAPVWAMIELQRCTGMRPGEVRIMRGRDLTTSGDVWEYRPTAHKTEHHDKTRVVMIGPRGQAMLREWLRTDTRAYLFSADADGKRPYERSAYRNAIIRGTEIAMGMPDCLRTPDAWLAAQEDLPDAQRAAKRRKLIADATVWRRQHCWSPAHLRHNFGTAARRAGGIEAARVTLGHSSIRTSEIYSEKDWAAARAVVAQIG